MNTTAKQPLQKIKNKKMVIPQLLLYNIQEVVILKASRVGVTTTVNQQGTKCYKNNFV